LSKKCIYRFCGERVEAFITLACPMNVAYFYRQFAVANTMLDDCS